MKQKIKNRYTGEVQFTAEIECSENSPMSKKLRLAVLWAIENRVSLRATNLIRADLSHADLSHADLSHTDLTHADLTGARLRGVDLTRADLSGVDLLGANLSHADLSHTDLTHADLTGARLRGVDLTRADLSGVDLLGANLSHADLRGAGLMCFKSNLYECYIQKEYMQIGCEIYSWDDWLSFDDKKILRMDGRGALKWWKVNKPILEAIRDSIEVSNDK